MKRYIAIILIFSLMLSITGCYGTLDTEELTNHVKDEISDALDEAWENAKQEIKDSIKEKWDELVKAVGDGFADLWDAITFWDSDEDKVKYTIQYIALGATDVPDDQVLAEGQKITKKIPVKEGYIFLGWSLAEDAVEASYKPRQKWDMPQSATLYAVWTECTHKNDKNELYGLNLETEGEVRCAQCSSILSPGIYFFSDYLKATQLFGNNDYTDLDDEELGEALAEYLELKGNSYRLILTDLGQNTPSFSQQAFETFHEGIKKADAIFLLLYNDDGLYNALVNKEHFEPFYTVDNIKFSVNTFRTIMTAAGTIDSFISFGESSTKLSEEKLLGISNTYNIEMQKIDAGIQFAQALGNVTGFAISLTGSQMYPGMIPTAENYREAITNLKYSAVSNNIFRSLPNIRFASNADQDHCVSAFRSTGEESIEVQKERWPAGPTAEQTIGYIKQLGENHPDIASWYFYLGWRMEYECACLIQMILADQV